MRNGGRRAPEGPTQAGTEHYGPDGAAYIISILGSIILVSVCVGLSIGKTVLVGPATLVFMLGMWYTVRMLVCSHVDLSGSGIDVGTPFRNFNASWSSIATIKSDGFIRVHGVKGERFKIPSYSTNPLTVFAIRYLKLFRRHLELYGQLDTFVSRYASKSGENYKFETRWTFPTIRYVVCCVLLATVAEVLSLTR